MIDYIGRFVSSVSTALEINQATLSGCIDVVVIEQEDGTLMCTPFHVRFGKLKVLKSKEKIVSIQVNGEEAPFKMKLGAAGDGYFEEQRRARLVEDFMSDDQSDPETYMSSEDDSEMSSSPQREGERIFASPKTEPQDKKKENEESKKKKKWAWLWKTSPEDAIQSEKEREAEMTDAIEKLVKNEIQGQERSELIHDLAKGPSESEIPEIKEPETKKRPSEEAQKMLEKELGNETLLDKVEHQILNEEKKEEQPNHHEVNHIKQDIEEEEEKGERKEIHKDMENGEKDQEKEKGDYKSNEKDKKKESSKRGILRSFLRMFGSDKQEKDKARIENFATSGETGTNLLMKPNSREGIMTESNELSFQDALENVEFSLDDTDDEKKTKKVETQQNASEFPPDADIELSLCASEIDEKENEDLTTIFLKHRVPFSKFIKDPFRVLSNPNLMVKIDDKLYDWKIACPLIVSLLAYKKPLPEEVLQELSERESTSSSSSWRNWFSLSKKDDKVKKEEKTKKDEKLKKDDKSKSDDKQKSVEKAKKEVHEPSIEKPSEEKHKPEEGEKDNKEMTHEEHQARLKDEKPPMITEKQILRENLAQEKLIAKAEGDSEVVESVESLKKGKVRRTLRPNSDMLKSLGLKPGCNTISYVVQGGIQGEKSLTANIYLWPENSKIVISDIDGTITKSDVLGQLMPMMGRDWSQPGVASLYSNIRKNGYQILYLTARAIGQSQLTKDFLNSITQNGGFSLPPGPVILSPDRLVPSFKREIIYRKPEVFKIACLRDLRSLFPPNHNPFYAGFGNRETDAIAYQAVGVPSGKIFTINPVGEIRLLNATYSKSYVLINDMVSDMFPSIQADDKYQASEEYNQVNYFKINYETLIDFDVTELL